LLKEGLPFWNSLQDYRDGHEGASAVVLARSSGPTLPAALP